MEASEIVERIDMVEYIGQYTDLTFQHGEWWGLSPFKAENTPSFSVRPEAKSWYDFSSGLHGNLIEFVKQMDNCSVREAINKLKSYAHITDEEAGQASLRLTATGVAKKFRQRVRANSTLSARMLPETVMNRYEFRRDKLQAWADEGISWESMKKFQIAYDPLDDRIVYPVRTNDGQIFCICGRTCDPDYKEKKIPKYIYSQPIGTQPALYALSVNRDEILNRKEIVLFEGCKSVMKADTWGILNTAALLTSHLSKLQFDALIQLASFHGVRVVFALDNDVDVTKDENICMLKRYAVVEVVHDTDGVLGEKDAPVDCGEEIWRKLYAQRRRLN